ncbi:MAG: hypothetical protein ACI8YQ_003034, partial [Polaribacter sp.]
PLFVTEFGNIKFLYGRQKTPTVKKFIKHWQLELPEMAKVELSCKAYKPSGIPSTESTFTLRHSRTTRPFTSTNSTRSQ